MLLPNGWLWDMVDEYVYKFQAYLQYRGKLLGKTMEEIQALKNADHGMWDSKAVIQTLEQLVARSGIKEELEAPGGPEALYTTEGYSTTS